MNISDAQFKLLCAVRDTLRGETSKHVRDGFLQLDYVLCEVAVQNHATRVAVPRLSADNSPYAEAASQLNRLCLAGDTAGAYRLLNTTGPRELAGVMLAAGFSVFDLRRPSREQSADFQTQVAKATRARQTGFQLNATTSDA